MEHRVLARRGPQSSRGDVGDRSAQTPSAEIAYFSSSFRRHEMTSAKILLEPPSELDEGKKAGLPRVFASDGLERCIRQILIREEVVQAWEHLDFGKARRWAAELDLRTDEFPLRGIIAG